MFQIVTLCFKAYPQGYAEQSCFLSFATVGILKPHDIVLTQIFTRLHLDKVERGLFRVFQPVHDSKWNIGRFVFLEIESLFATGNPRRAVDDNPVLGPLVVFL